MNNNDDRDIIDGKKVYIINMLFDGIARNTVDIDCKAEKPFFENGYWIGCLDIATLVDGMHVELCNWWMDGMTFWDLSISKDEFKKNTNKDFLPYLDGLGGYFDTVLDRFACQWRYCGIQPDDQFYRIQYYLENEDED